MWTRPNLSCNNFEINRLLKKAESGSSSDVISVNGHLLVYYMINGCIVGVHSYSESECIRVAFNDVPAWVCVYTVFYKKKRPPT